MSQNEETFRVADACAAIEQCGQTREAAPEDHLATAIAHVKEARQHKDFWEAPIRAANQRSAELRNGRVALPVRTTETSTHQETSS